LALFTVNASTASSFYAGQFYVMIFMQQAVGIEQATVYKLILVGCLLGAPAYVGFGWLSDKIGRKWLMIAGMFLTALCFRPLFAELQDAGNPALAAAIREKPVTVHASTEGAACDFSLMATMLSSHADNNKPCVKAKKFLVSKGIGFEYSAPLPGQVIAMSVGGQTVNDFDTKTYSAALASAGYPSKADNDQIDSKRIILILFILSVISAMIYGPVAAYLVELFPPNVRYTALSMPYHIGAGIGGALPFAATYLGLSNGNVLAGLWYPIVVTLVGGVLGSLLLPNRRALAEDE
jgi:MFS family permease